MILGSLAKSDKELLLLNIISKGTIDNTSNTNHVLQ